MRRSSDDRVIAGVCGGLARYFGIDPVIVRIAAVVLLFVGGIAAVAYLAAIIVMPADDAEGTERSPASKAATVIGVVVLVIAALVALDDVTFGWGWDSWLGPLIPIAIVSALLVVAGRRLLARRGEHDAPLARVAGATLLFLAGCLVVGAVALGAAWATAAGGGEAVAGALILAGVAMVVLSFRGGARWLILPVLAVALPSGVVAAADIDVDGGVGHRSHRPVTVADLPADGYELGVGELSVDLRRLRWPSTPVRLKLDVGVGHAVVYVPTDVCVRSEAQAGAGYIDVLGEDDAGFDVESDAGATIPQRTPALILDAEIGMGAIEVRHTPSDRRGPGRHRGDRDAISADLDAAGCAGKVAS